MEFEFVNVHGQPWSPSAAATQQKIRPRGGGDPSKPAAMFLGWEVTGFTADRIQQAKRQHQAESDSRVAEGRDPLPPFSADAWMDKAKPLRVNLLQTRAAADDCATLADRCGWLRVKVAELVKGDPNWRPAGMR